MKIVVTGGAGFIGSVVSHHLLEQGHDIVVVDDLSRGQRNNVPAERLKLLHLQDTEALTQLLAGADAVMHFAGYIAVNESVHEPELYFSNNIGGALSLFSAMHRAGVKHIIFSSTAAVYGEPTTIPIPESAPIAPVNPYGQSKAFTEKLLEKLDQYRGLHSVILRYFNACGAEPTANLGEMHKPETHLIPLIFRAITTGKPISIFGNDYPTSDGTCVRDYIHVTDLATAHLAALDHLIKNDVSDVFNVGTGSGHSVMDLLNATERVTGHKVPYIITARRDGDPPELVADSNKLQRTLGWRPTRSNIEEILRDAWTFYQAHGNTT